MGKAENGGAKVDRDELRNLNYTELQELMQEWGQPSFRGQQIFRWLHQKGVTEWEKMSNIPKNLLELLASSYTLSEPKVSEMLESQADGTIKFLLELADSETIEMVLMFHGLQRRTLCISTQVGCRLKCSFCATGQSGFKRNLATSEIIDQVLLANQELALRGHGPVTNLVFMGMGEPLDNYSALVKALRILNHEDGLNISYRRMTVSTSGMVPGIYRLAQEGLPIVLAISLHGTNDQLRSSLMPINQPYPLDKLFAACHYWVEQTKRRITFEYIMLDGVNDELEQAQELVLLLRGLPANVNLIPFNPVEETKFGKSPKHKIESFRRYLEKQGIIAVVREEKGGDIHAACGQLRRQEMRGNIDYQI